MITEAPSLSEPFITQIPSIDSKPSVSDVLHCLLPPRRFDRDGHSYEQYVSTEPSTREDACALGAALKTKLSEWHARPSGLCPMKEEVFKELFDELIRQITIDCPETGIILLRIRDELRMRITCYQCLYESGVIFSGNKQEGAHSVQEEELSELEKVKLTLEAEAGALRARLFAAEQLASERRSLRLKRNEESINFAKQQGSHMEKFLRGLERAQAVEEAS